MSELLPILMPTAPRYASLAQWTVRQIGRFWSSHPPVIFCGANLSGAVPLSEDPSNWMLTVRAACRDLLGRGIDYAYVILDDHPPIAAVSADLLREALPRAAREVDATSIALGGYGPLNSAKAPPRVFAGVEMECLPLSEAWKLPLHPALWNLHRMGEILDTLIGRLAPQEQTAWAFERVGSNSKAGGVSESLLSSCWRVNGWRTASAGAHKLHDAGDRLLRIALRARLLAIRAFSNEAKAGAFSARFAGLFHPRIGPYPCFWSGVMRKGRINSDYLAYARFKRRPELVEGLEAAFAGCVQQ